VPSPTLAAIVDLAARQHGVVSTRQLTSLGLSHAAIRHRLATGLLTRIHRGVYSVGIAALTDRGRFAAALLACGPGALLSHRSAAILWGLLAMSDGPVDVVTPARQSRSRAGIRVHRTSALRPRDRRIRDGLPVTSPALTILDLASHDGDLAASALNEALLHRLTGEREVRELLADRNGHPGAGVLGRLLAASGGGFSRQVAEKTLRRLIQEAGLPKPRRNSRVHGHELDFWWPEARLNVEMDGYRWHSTRARLNRDRDRDAELSFHGIRVLRISYDQLARPQWVVAHLAAAIVLGRQ